MFTVITTENAIIMLNVTQKEGKQIDMGLGYLDHLLQLVVNKSIEKVPEIKVAVSKFKKLKDNTLEQFVAENEGACTCRWPYWGPCWHWQLWWRQYLIVTFYKPSQTQSQPKSQSLIPQTPLQAEDARYMSSRDAADMQRKVPLPLMSWDGGLPISRSSLWRQKQPKNTWQSKPLYVPLKGPSQLGEPLSLLRGPSLTVLMCTTLCTARRTCPWSSLLGLDWRMKRKGNWRTSTKMKKNLYEQSISKHNYFKNSTLSLNKFAMLPIMFCFYIEL